MAGSCGCLFCRQDPDSGPDQSYRRPGLVLAIIAVRLQRFARTSPGLRLVDLFRFRLNRRVNRMKRQERKEGRVAMLFDERDRLVRQSLG